MRPKFLKLQNFKSVGAEAQTIDLAPITLLFGPNSAGKSTVLQSLLFLRELLLNRNYDPDLTELGGEAMNLGGFRNLIHQRDTSAAITISLGFDLEVSDSLPSYLSEYEQEALESLVDDSWLPFLSDEWQDDISEISIIVSLRWSESLQSAYAETAEVALNGRRFARIRSSSDTKQIYFEELDFGHPILSAGEEDEGLGSHIADVLGVDAGELAAMDSGLEQLLRAERPFETRTIAELADMIDSMGTRSLPLLKKLEDELQQRPQRRASALLQKLRETGASKGATRSAVILGVLGQLDALPDPSRGIRLHSDAWSTETEEEGVDQEIRVSHLKAIAEGVVSSIVAGGFSLVRDWLSDVIYIGPLRHLPARDYRPQLTPDFSHWASGLAAWESLHSISDSKIREMNFWLDEERLSTGYQISRQRIREVPVNAHFLTLLEREMDEDDQDLLKEALEQIPIKTSVCLVEESTGLEVMPQDIGVGISQLFPVVAAAVMKDTGVVAIEQPELHIHPAIQVRLGDLFARSALRSNSLFLLETHSEHLLLRLLRRIREAEQSSTERSESDVLTKDKLSVQYVEPTQSGTEFQTLRVNADGDFIDEWPGGFFEERDDEVFL